MHYFKGTVLLIDSLLTCLLGFLFLIPASSSKELWVCALRIFLGTKLPHKKNLFKNLLKTETFYFRILWSLKENCEGSTESSHISASSFL